MNSVEMPLFTTPHALSASNGSNLGAQLSVLDYSGGPDSSFLRIIQQNNPAATALVSSRFSALNKDQAFALEVFNGFSAHIQQQIHGAGPLPRQAYYRHALMINSA